MCQMTSDTHVTTSTLLACQSRAPHFAHATFFFRSLGFLTSYFSQAGSSNSSAIVAISHDTNKPWHYGYGTVYPASVAAILRDVGHVSFVERHPATVALPARLIDVRTRPPQPTGGAACACRTAVAAAPPGAVVGAASPSGAATHGNGRAVLPLPSAVGPATH